MNKKGSAAQSEVVVRTAKELKRIAEDISVLYVEDDNDIREFTIKVLSRFFNVVESASDGDEGLYKYAGGRYDIVITDIRMPRLDGIQMARIIREENPEQPIIVTSAYNEVQYLYALVNIGISSFVMKPLEKEKFLSALYQACKKIKQERAIADFHNKLEQLCKSALEKHLESDFIKEAIKLHNITPGNFRNDNWPYPLKVYTLGRFEIEINDKFVDLSGKVHRKPVEMLKAIIALGGKDVGMAQLLDALWPEVDGDLAAISFRTTLYRLRKLIGLDYDIIVVTGKHVSINSDYCWIDIWSLGDTIDEFKHAFVPSPDEQKIHKLYKKASSVYKGGFLPLDEDKPWAVEPGKRLKSEFVNLCFKAGTFFEESGNWDNAIKCYKSAVDADALREECYRRKMACYMRAGLKAEALALYNKCKLIFETVPAVGLSAETGELLNSSLSQ